MNPRVAIGVLAALGSFDGFGRGFPASTPPRDKGVFPTGRRSGNPTYMPSPYDCIESKRAERKRERQNKKRGRRAA